MGASGGGGGAAAGAGGGKAGEVGAREREVLAWAEANAPGSFTAWTPVTLPDGTKAEVGGLDPFIELNPPMAVLKPALAAHTETVLDLAGKLAKVEILSLDVSDLGGGVYRVKAVAGNRGYLATHTKQDARARAHLPVRLTLRTGRRRRLGDRLPGRHLRPPRRHHRHAEGRMARESPLRRQDRGRPGHRERRPRPEDRHRGKGA